MPPAEAAVVACTGDGGTRLERRPWPRPGPGELVLRLSACGLCGTDLFKLRHGVAPGTVLGHELVGAVESAGAGVERFAPGQRVVVPHHVACGRCRQCQGGSETLCATFREDLLAPGGFSEAILVRRRAVERAARPVPDDLADDAALFLEPAACVLRGVRRAGLLGGPPPVAAVLGAGSMGLLHLLVLTALWPAAVVVVVDPMPERRELARALGAVAVPPAAAAEELARRAGADAVFDTAGGSGPLATALSLTREGGTVVLFAHSAPGESAGFDLNDFFKSERRLVATYSGSLEEQEIVFELLAGGRLDPTPLVSGRLPLSRFDEAVRRTEAREALKMVLVPDER
ncbi:MAG: alcohol dehydrogenase catalytic domain-containing protein [Thermoanaerobaculia bacterium]|nr:alcohol dehydrogenase catalytic domain-containing protein [Thermoanaerobaculia bacterium]